MNVLWGAANAVVGYVLLYHVGNFTATRWREVALVGLGAVLMALRLSKVFGDVYGATPRVPR